MIDNTKKVMELVKQIGLSLKDVTADGKVGWEDLPKMIPILAKLRPAIEGAQLMGPELGKMTDAEITEITALFAEILAIYISAFQKPQPPVVNTVQPL
jgi:hypothetical protein